MFKLASKDLKIFFADRRGLLLSLLLPIGLITLFALVFGGNNSEESPPMTLTIVDEDQSSESKKLIKDLDSLQEFVVKLLPAEKAEALVKKGDSPQFLLLPKGMKDSMDKGMMPSLELKYDAAKEAEIAMVQGALMGRLMGLVGRRTIEKNVLQDIDKDFPGMDPETRKAVSEKIKNLFGNDDSKEKGSKSGTEMTETRTSPAVKMTALVAKQYNSPGLVQAVAGTAIMMLLFSVVALGASILDEKQEGTFKRLLFSPMSPNSILLGKMIATNLVSWLQLSVMFVFAWLVFGLDLFVNPPALVLMILATAFAISSFGVFLASIAKSRQQVQGLSTLIILIMSCIGGSMIPLFIMPIWMQKAAMFSVNYWGIQGFFDIFWRRLAFTDPVFLSRVAVLIIIGVVLNSVAFMLFRKNVLHFN